jgi:hypothetical protein
MSFLSFSNLPDCDKGLELFDNPVLRVFGCLLSVSFSLDSFEDIPLTKHKSELFAIGILERLFAV